MEITVKRLRHFEKELGEISSEYSKNYGYDNDIDVIIVAKDSNGVLKYYKTSYGWSAYLEHWTYEDGYERIPIKLCETIPEVVEQIWYTKGIRVKIPIKLERELKLEKLNEI